MLQYLKLFSTPTINSNVTPGRKKQIQKISSNSIFLLTVDGVNNYIIVYLLIVFFFAPSNLRQTPSNQN